MDEINNKLNELKNNNKLEVWEKSVAAIGVALFEDGDNMDSLFKRADQEMYKRKKEMKDNN